MNTSAYADTAVRESPFFYYIYKKSFVYPYTHRKTKYIIFFVLCEQEKVPLIPFLVCMTTKKAAYTLNFLLKICHTRCFFAFFLVKLLLSRVCFLVNITDFVDAKMEIHLCRRNIGMSHHLLDAL